MSDDPGWRPCVGVMLAQGGRLFVGRRADRPEAAWQMPQGGIDEGEDAHTAALRELEEETGIPASLVEVEAVAAEPVTYEVPKALRPPHWRGRYKGQALTWVLLRFRGTDGQVSVATAHPEFSDWRWADPAEVVDGIVDWKRGAYEQALREFGSRL